MTDPTNTNLDNEGADTEHFADHELVELYMYLEDVGQVVPGDPRSVTQQLEDGQHGEPHAIAGRAPLRAGAIGGSPFVSRADWGARAPKTPNSTNITPSGNTGHYLGGGRGPDDHARCAGYVRGVQAYHMDHNGWNDIAYSSLECKHGYIFEGRWLGHRTAANGTDVSNQSQYAHCGLLGDDDTVMPDAMKQAQHDVVAFFQRNGSGGGLHVHQDWYSTSCAGPLIIPFWRAGVPAPGGGAPAPAPAPSPAPAPAPAPSPGPAPGEDQGTRIRQLQGLLGVAADGIMGPNTQAAMGRNMVGWSGYVRTGARLDGNNNRDLVRWVQHQCNRKTGNTGRYGEDGIIGPNTNDGIVNVLGQRDGVCGPAGFTEATR